MGTTGAARSIWWPALGVLGLLCGTAQAEVIHDPKLGFTLTLPEGFKDFPPGRQQPKTPYSYIKGEPGSDDFAIVGIELLGGTIGRDPLTPSMLPQVEGAKFEVRREKWKSFDIDVMAGVATQDQARMFVLVAQVPLRPRAIQLKLVGPEAQQAGLVALLRSLLGSLDGPSNWLTDEERSLKAGRAIGGLAFILALGGWSIWRWRKRRKDSVASGGASS